MNAEPGFPQSLTLPVEGMSCASCVGRVERTLKAVPGVLDASVNLAAERADVSLDAAVDQGTIVQAVEDLGYRVPQRSVTLAVEGMTCAGCVRGVENALTAVPGVTSANVNLATEKAVVTGTASIDDLIAAVGTKGKTARVLSGDEGRAYQVAKRDEEARQLKRRVAVAGILTLPVFVLEMGSHLIPAMHHLIMGTIGLQASWLIQFALTTAVLAGPGRAFYLQGIPALIRGAPDMNSLVAVGHGGSLSLFHGRNLRPWRAARGHGQRLLRGRRGDRDADPCRPMDGGAGEGPHVGGDPATGAACSEDSACPARGWPH